jgi:signal transduction histidine kinase
VAAATPLLGNTLMAGTLLVAALARKQKLLPAGRPWVAVAVGSGILAAGIAELGGWALRHALVDAGGEPATGVAQAAQHPVALGLSLLAAALLVVAAFRFAGEARSDHAVVAPLFAGAAILLAATQLHYLALPTLAPDWVAPREGIRSAAFAFILVALLRQDAKARLSLARAAATDERRRLARDLHDGLAQDLAFIAAHGDRMTSVAGAEHPVAIAARRALALSRGAIAELSAADAPTAEQALRDVAGELSTRYEMRVDVNTAYVAISRTEREDVVRIAREAIVNAARHGGARKVLVSLLPEADRLVLRVSDDGRGIGPAPPRPGFGFLSMRERAAVLGGSLTARQRDEGGTELELVVP